MNFSGITTEVEFVAVRSRGPGGQNVNKVSSAAQLHWDFTSSPFVSHIEKGLIYQKLYNHINSENQIYIRSDEYRDLERNKERCLEKLKDYLVKAFFKPKPRKATKPTRSSRLKRKETKKKHSETKKMRQKVRY